jgi:uncharacterized membrane protein
MKMVLSFIKNVFRTVLMAFLLCWGIAAFFFGPVGWVVGIIMLLICLGLYGGHVRDKKALLNPDLDRMASGMSNKP